MFVRNSSFPVTCSVFSWQKATSLKVHSTFHPDTGLQEAEVFADLHICKLAYFHIIIHFLNSAYSMQASSLTSKPHLPILDGLRGVAALMVVAYACLRLYDLPVRRWLQTRWK